MRPILDRRYAEDIENVKQRFEDRAGSGRGFTELSDIARASTFGAIDTLLVDIDTAMPGMIDETNGAMTLAAKAGPLSYDVLDEIAARTINAAARCWL